MLSKLLSGINLYITEAKLIRPHIAELKRDIENKTVTRSFSDPYTPEYETKTYREYKETFLDGTNKELIYRNKYVLEKVGRLPFRAFVNYGSMYGWIENEMSKRHASVGLDRSKTVQDLNAVEFPCCSFVTSDNIFQHIEDNKVLYGNSLFSCINILVFFTPEYIKLLFQNLNRVGVKYVSIYEPYGFSLQTYSYYRQDPEHDKDPVIFRRQMILHNYSRYLTLNGFEIVEMEIVNTPHPTDPLFRSIFILAKRKE